MNTDTQTSPGIGLLPDGLGFAAQGGCIIDVVGLNGTRITAQRSASSMFVGWTGPDGPNQRAPYPPGAWLVVSTTSLDPTPLAAQLGGGILKANFRITLYDGDSGSPNPVYVAMFGAGNFPYARWSPQPGNYDFDGGQALYMGFQDVAGNPVNCGYMGESTTYRLDADGATVESFTGFPGVYALTDPNILVARPPEYLPPFPVTGWFSVPADKLSAFYAVLLSGTVRIGVHDVTPGDQYYDFLQGLAGDVVNIPFAPPPPFGISCNNPPPGVVATPYAHRFTYSQNTVFFGVSITAGSLPAGLQMTREGVVSGTPISAGVFPFTVTVADSLGNTASVSCSITIIAAPSGPGGSNVAF